MPNALKPAWPGVTRLEQPERVEREGRERRVRTEEAGHDGGAHPGVLEPGLERLDHEADQERSADVDDEDAPRERPRAPADQLVEAVAGEGTEGAGDRDPDHDGHPAEDTGDRRRSSKPNGRDPEEAREAGNQASHDTGHREEAGAEEANAPPS